MAGNRDGSVKTAAIKCNLTVEEYKAASATQKWCTGCKRWRDKCFFGKDSSRGDGFSALCNDCRRTKKQTAHGGPKVRILSAPDHFAQQAAKDAVRRAVEAKRLAPVRSLPCFDCGKKASHYHHHLGYAKSHLLDVVALCPKCHAARHFVKVS